jgi:PAS domain-containing protein
MIQRSRASRAEAVRTRRVLDALGTGVIVRDASGTILDWNAATLRMLDLTDSQLLGREQRVAGWRLLPDEGPPFTAAADVLQAALDRAAGTGRTTVRILAGDRAAAWIAILANVEPDATRPGAIETTFTLTDITEQRIAER